MRANLPDVAIEDEQPSRKKKINQSNAENASGDSQSWQRRRRDRKGLRAANVDLLAEPGE